MGIARERRVQVTGVGTLLHATDGLSFFDVEDSQVQMLLENVS